tara:strand:+ start:2643 stop:2753 length:111 start_codon:yes stop_codon:yes gene_type:complete
MTLIMQFSALESSLYQKKDKIKLAQQMGGPMARQPA